MKWPFTGALGLSCPPTDSFTEGLLSIHEAELQRVKACYERARPLLECVDKWEKNWALFQDFEVQTHTCAYVHRRAETHGHARKHSLKRNPAGLKLF